MSNSIGVWKGLAGKPIAHTLWAARTPDEAGFGTAQIVAVLEALGMKPNPNTVGGTWRTESVKGKGGTPSNPGPRIAWQDWIDLYAIVGQVMLNRRRRPHTYAQWIAEGKRLFALATDVKGGVESAQRRACRSSSGGGRDVAYTPLTDSEAQACGEAFYADLEKYGRDKALANAKQSSDDKAIGGKQIPTPPVAK